MSAATARGAGGTGPDRRQFLYGGLLIATSAAAAALAPRRSAFELDQAAFEQAIPAAIGSYRAAATALAAPLPDVISQRLYDHVSSRIYFADGSAPIMLLVAYGGAENGTRAIHRPDDCYSAAGYQVTTPLPVPLSGSGAGDPRALALTASLDRHVEQIYFWTRVGDVFPLSARAEHIDVFKDNLRGSAPDGVLVRLSILSADRAAGLRQLMVFNAHLLSGLAGVGRRLLLGPHA